MDKFTMPLYAVDRKPYIITEAGPIRKLAVRIADILVEHRRCQKGDAVPYARLVVEGTDDAGDRKTSGASVFQAVFIPMEACVIVGAIEEWKNHWISGFRSKKSPCALVQVDRLLIQLYNPTRGQSAYADFTFVEDDAKTQSVVLSPTEATLIARTIGSIVPDYAVRTD